MDEEDLWYAMDMDNGIIAVARTRRNVMQLACVPTRRQWRGRWERHTYGPGSEEIVWSHPGEDGSDTVSIEHGLGALTSAGWEHFLEAWRKLGSPLGVRVDETDTEEGER